MDGKMNWRGGKMERMTGGMEVNIFKNSHVFSVYKFTLLSFTFIFYLFYLVLAK